MHLVRCCIRPDRCKLHIVHIAFVFWTGGSIKWSETYKQMKEEKQLKTPEMCYSVEAVRWNCSSLREASHRHGGDSSVKIEPAVSEISSRTDRQTDRQTCRPAHHNSEQISMFSEYAYRRMLELIWMTSCRGSAAWCENIRQAAVPGAASRCLERRRSRRSAATFLRASAAESAAWAVRPRALLAEWQRS